MRPTRKVNAGLVAGALVIVIVFVVKAIWPTLNVTAELVAALQTIGTFALQWVVPDADDEPAPSEGPGQTAGGQPPPKL